MAICKVVYQYSREGDVNCRKNALLCFICATKKALVANTDLENIMIATTCFEYHQCEDCGKFIGDTINI